jgi:hypothetical protein
MSNTSRYRYGETNPIVAKVQTQAEIEIGDLLFWNPDDGAAPCALQIDLGDELSNQGQFAQSFLGVSLESCPAGTIKPIRVATTGVFEFDCAADEYALGALVGACANGVDGHLENQKVASVPEYFEAIGRSAQAYPSQITKIMVEIRSAIMQGGVQPNYSEQREVYDNTYSRL